MSAHLQNTTLLGAVQGAAKLYGKKHTMLFDALGGELSFGKLLLGTKVLRRTFVKHKFDQLPYLPILLPNTVGLAPIMLAAMACGTVPAILNYTAGESNLKAALKTVQAKVMITSRAFIAKAKLEELIESLSQVVRVYYMEDLRAGISTVDKVLGIIMPLQSVGVEAHDTAFVLFTSGSEGVPKGVAISHGGLLANIEQTLERIDFTQSDKMFCALPLFHSFGMMAGLWLPILAGFQSYLFPSPLQYKTICAEVKRTQATVFISTDTFLKGYAREAQMHDFASVRLLVAGAEAVKSATRTLWRERMGLEILEGYGVTECSPVICVNTPTDAVEGTVGRLYPRMEARLEAVAGLAEGGRLQVRGPNVMKGYIFADNPGVIVPPVDGWYDTGDIVSLDAQNFIRIQGRAKRFAKIGGEMVSLVAVEGFLQDYFDETPFAVIAKGDDKKGERLVLVIAGAQVPDLLDIKKYLRGKGATELMMPSDIQMIPEIPLLGSGKVDYVTLLSLFQS